MTDITPTELLNTPLTPEAAAARHAELSRDPEYGKAAAAGDMVKVAELTKLWRISRGMTADPIPPANPEQVRERMLDRDREFDDRRLETWERLIRMDDQMRLEHRRGMATRAQVEDAKLAIEQMTADASFRQRVLSKEQVAFKAWMLAGRVASMQVISE
jgi:hypothetical protein